MLKKQLLSKEPSGRDRRTEIQRMGFKEHGTRNEFINIKMQTIKSALVLVAFQIKACHERVQLSWPQLNCENIGS